MLRLGTDENFNNRILLGLLRREPEIDIVRVQDVGLMGKGDEEVLEWCAKEDRCLLTHDVSTMKRYVDERIAAGLRMPGVFEIREKAPIGQSIEEILIVAECSLPNEWEGRIVFLPLR
ncbi:MAG TPA: DUF5615 family PIN-like protein [Pyrinomonadaceae bacterium]|nr:DUF5615 family PIN-like protein [Pyrinomonadaceae bacterium]